MLFSIQTESLVLCINVEGDYAMKICLAWRVARLESPLHSADIGVVWGANLPLRSRPPRCGSLIGLWVTMASTIVCTKKQAAQSTAAGTGCVSST